MPLRMLGMQRRIHSAALLSLLSSIQLRAHSLCTQMKGEYTAECTQNLGNCTASWDVDQIHTCVTNYGSSAMGSISGAVLKRFTAFVGTFSYTGRLFEVKDEHTEGSNVVPTLLAGTAAASALIAVAMYVRVNRAGRDVQMATDDEIEDG